MGDWNETPIYLWNPQPILRNDTPLCRLANVRAARSGRDRILLQCAVDVCKLEIEFQLEIELTSSCELNLMIDAWREQQTRDRLRSKLSPYDLAKLVR